MQTNEPGGEALAAGTSGSAAHNEQEASVSGEHQATVMQARTSRPRSGF